MRAVTHLPVKLLLACLLAVAMLATLAPLPLFAAEAGPSVAIRALREDDTAVRYADSSDARLKVEGQAPAGSRITAAQLIALGADGAAVGDPQVVLGDNRNNPDHAAEDDYLFVDANGNIQGALSLLCANFGSRQTSCPSDPATAVRDVRLDIAVDGAPLQSNTYRVDYDRPYVRGYELIASNQIRVVFSEPVRSDVSELVQRNGWKVEGVDSVANVANPGGNDCQYAAGEDADAGTSGCTRILTLGQALDQDATPRVTFMPSALIPAYKDGASNQMLFGTELNADNQADSDAADLIRPVAPHIQSIDGKTGSGSSIVSNSTSPEARITNLTGGHTVEVTVQRPSGTTVKLTEQVPAGATSLDLTIPASSDGQYTISAVGIDTNGNRSDDTTKNPPALAKDGARPSATYTLDTVAPQVLAAELRDRRTVSIRLTETILPDGHAGEWFVGDVPVTATGSGDTRTLTSSIDLTNPGAVRWEPTSTAPGSVGRYGDVAGNGMLTVAGIALNDLPPVQAPRVTSPSRVTYTNASGVRITGTGPSRSGLAVDLFEQGSDKAIRSASVSGGRWSLDHALNSDGRYSYAVQLRDTQTGAASPRVPVADVVRDTAAPKITVLAPATSSVPGPLATPQEYGVGDTVTVRWKATDPANDPQRPDHGREATIFLVDEDGSRRAVKTGIQHQAGQEQSATYTLKTADLAGSGTRDLHFDVAVSDVAGNVGQSSSGTIRLLDTLIGYRAVLAGLTANGSSSVIRADFPVQLQGNPAQTDWKVDGEPVPAQMSDNRRTVILTVPLSDDPNAVHSVVYQPALPVNQLQDENGRQVSGAARDTIDRIVPALGSKAPRTNKVIDQRAVRFTGTTDTTGRPNTIAAFPADRRGARTGPAIATKRAGTNGSWSMSVPLDPNRKNRIVIQAVDPSGNRSKLSGLYTVIEDSKRPVLRMVSPDDGDTVRAVKKLRWKTSEANKRKVAIAYKKRNAARWSSVTSGTADDGVYRWELPKRRLRGSIFNLRITAIDATGKRDVATARGLRANFRR